MLKNRYDSIKELITSWFRKRLNGIRHSSNFKGVFRKMWDSSSVRLHSDSWTIRSTHVQCCSHRIIYSSIELQHSNFTFIDPLIKSILMSHFNLFIASHLLLQTIWSFGSDCWKGTILFNIQVDVIIHAEFKNL